MPASRNRGDFPQRAGKYDRCPLAETLPCPILDALVALRNGECSVRRATLRRQRLIVVFLMGILLLFSPVFSLFERPGAWLGIPFLYFYLFGTWAALIAATAWITRDPEE